MMVTWLVRKYINFKNRYNNIGENTQLNISSNIDRKSKVGSYCYIGKNSHITKAKIGNYCSIANNVAIGQGENDIKLNSTSSLFYENTYEELTKENCIIEHDVWIGTGAVVLRGVVIGTGAVIGANAVVTKDIPPYAIAVGCPAKVIKYRFEEDRIRNLLASNWWDFELTQVKELFRKMS